MPRKTRKLGNAAPRKRGGMSKKMAATKIGSKGTQVARTPVTRRAKPMSSR